MRSEQVYRALEQGHTRFEICQLVSKGVRVAHKPGSRFEDTINSTFVHLGPRVPTHEGVVESRSKIPLVPAA
jgi:hypothetical protein